MTLNHNIFMWQKSGETRQTFCVVSSALQVMALW